MSDPLLLPEIRLMLAEGDEAGLADLVTAMHPASTANFIEELSDEELWQLLQYAPIERQAAIFSFLPLRKQVDLVSGMGRERMSKLLEEMSPDDRVDLLQHLDEEVVESLLPLVAKADREDIRRLLSYPEDSAASVMTTDYASLPSDITVDEAINIVRRQAPDRETIYYIYVVDEYRHLIGIVSLRDLVLAKGSTRIADIMQRDVVAVRAELDQEEVARQMARYDFIAIPVVDHQHRLIGIITFDDLADIVEDEATEDFHLTAAVSPLAHGYHESRVWTLFRRRAGWLLILVFVNLVSSGVIAAYQETLEAVIALAFFLPLLIDSGGNTGSQAATLIIRALATEEIRLSEWLSTVLKELGVGLALGFAMAIASFFLGVFRGGLEVGLIVGISMLGIVMVTNLIGVLLPFALTRLRIDPAVASSPLITTIADATGLLLYFNVAAAVMSQGWLSSAASG
jgi:magnesium transporter